MLDFRPVSEVRTFLTASGREVFVLDGQVGFDLDALIAACNSKACAPPPVGRGGSLPSGSGSALPNGADPEPYAQALIKRWREWDILDDGILDGEEAWDTMVPKDPVVRMRIGVNELNSILHDDGVFKSQHETGSSRGVFAPEKREWREREMFSAANTRPKYGYLSERDQPSRSTGSLSFYGDISVEFKDEVAKRTTFTVGDSLDEELAAMKVEDIPSASPERRAVTADSLGSYVEAQIHGTLTLNDVVRIYVTNRDYYGYNYDNGSMKDEPSPVIRMLAQKYPDIEIVITGDGRTVPFSVCETHSEFACKSRACAPPPVGTGGSLPSGGIDTSERGRSPLADAKGMTSSQFRDRFRSGPDDPAPPAWEAVAGRLGKTGDTLNPFNGEEKVAAKIQANERIAENAKKSAQFKKGVKEFLDTPMDDDFMEMWMRGDYPKDMRYDVVSAAIRAALGIQGNRPPSSLVPKGSTVRDLLNRLANPDEELLMIHDGSENRLKGKTAEDIVTQLLVRQFVDGWAKTSNDSDPRSISKQMAAAEMHGIDYESFYKEYRHKGAKVDKVVMQEARDQLNRDRDILQALTQAEYDATQAFFKEAGIRTVTLFRGVSTEYSESAPSVGDVVQSGSNPLSSWSTDWVTAAQSFGGARNQNLVGLTFAMDVPVEMIQAMPVTGRGCLHEYEAVVIGYPSEMLVVNVS